MYAIIKEIKLSGYCNLECNLLKCTREGYKNIYFIKEVCYELLCIEHTDMVAGTQTILTTQELTADFCWQIAQHLSPFITNVLRKLSFTFTFYYYIIV